MNKNKKTIHSLMIMIKTVVALNDPSDQGELNELIRRNITNIVDDEIVDDAITFIASPIEKESDLPKGWALEGIPYTLEGPDVNRDFITVKDYLKPSIPIRDCPFCGSEMSADNLSSFVDHSDPFDPVTMHSLECKVCGAGFTGTTQDSVILRWNKRNLNQ